MANADELPLTFAQLVEVAAEANQRADALLERTWAAEQARVEADRKLKAVEQAAREAVEAMDGSPADVVRAMEQLKLVSGWSQSGADASR